MLTCVVFVLLWHSWREGHVNSFPSKFCISKLHSLSFYPRWHWASSVSRSQWPSWSKCGKRIYDGEGKKAAVPISQVNQDVYRLFLGHGKQMLKISWLSHWKSFWNTLNLFHVISGSFRYSRMGLCTILILEHQSWWNNSWSGTFRWTGCERIQISGNCKRRSLCAMQNTLIPECS